MNEILTPRNVRDVLSGYVARVAKSIERLLVSPSRLHCAFQTWVSADDARVFWFIQTYRDLARLRRTLAQLRPLYPESQISVVSDGDPDPAIRQVCDRYAAEFTFRTRLYGVDHGGELVQQILEAFLLTEADILVKIDPDTNVRRRFSIMPPLQELAVYGTVQTALSGANRLDSIQGGCIIVPRAAAVNLVRSGLLRSDRLKPPALEWAVSQDARSRAAAGLTSSDQTLGWACRELGMPCRDHPEVFSRYRATLIDSLTDHRVAVSHPRFEIGQIASSAFYLPGLRAVLQDLLRK